MPPHSGTYGNRTQNPRGVLPTRATPVHANKSRLPAALSGRRFHEWNVGIRIPCKRQSSIYEPDSVLSSSRDLSHPQTAGLTNPPVYGHTASTAQRSMIHLLSRLQEADTLCLLLPVRRCQHTGRLPACTSTGTHVAFRPPPLLTRGCMDIPNHKGPPKTDALTAPSISILGIQMR